jgi:hypothetical protein
LRKTPQESGQIRPSFEYLAAETIATAMVLVIFHWVNVVVSSSTPVIPVPPARPTVTVCNVEMTAAVVSVVSVKRHLLGLVA